MKNEEYKTFKIDLFEEGKKDIDVIEEKVVEEDKKNSVTKISLHLYVEDWLDLVKFRTYKVLEMKQLDYTLASAIEYGLSLLEKKYTIERGKDKITLQRGRRISNEKDMKASSLDISGERVDFINDFLYHKVFVENNLKYTRAEMFQEIVELIKKENKVAFK